MLCGRETDKATVEMECMEKGFLAKIIQGDGSKRKKKVGEVIAITVKEKKEQEKKKKKPEEAEKTNSRERGGRKSKKRKGKLSKRKEEWTKMQGRKEKETGI